MRNTRREWPRPELSTPLTYLGALLLVLWTVTPAYWLLISAISPSHELAAYPPHWFPNNPTLERLRAITGGGTLRSSSMQTMAAPAAFFRHAVLNSTIVAGTTTLLCLALGSLAGYAFARLRFPGRSFLMVLPLALQMLPPIALVIPLYSLVQALHLIDTLVGLILVYPSFLLVYVVWVMSGFYQNIPGELEDAARVDGCSRLGTFLRIVVPLSTPAFFSTGLLTFLLAWDEFLYALVLTSSQAKTLPVAVGEFSTQFGIDYGMMMAGGLLASIPPVIIALFFQPLLVRGLTAGSIKG
jgi:multiple sugar transport system permease protein